MAVKVLRGASVSFLLCSVVLQTCGDSGADVRWDESGYVLYCPCMGNSFSHEHSFTRECVIYEMSANRHTGIIARVESMCVFWTAFVNPSVLSVGEDEIHVTRNRCMSTERV